MRVKHTGNTLLPVACSDHGVSRVELGLCLRHGRSLRDRRHLGGRIILNRILRRQGLLYVLYGAVQIHRWRVRGYGARVDGKGHVPLTIRKTLVNYPRLLGMDGGSYLIMRVGSQLLSSTRGVSMEGFETGWGGIIPMGWR